MPKTKISEYSTTNSANTDIESINIDEGCAPSGINNAIRELMVHLKEFQTGSSGDPLTVAGGMFISGGGSANTMTVTGILTASGGTILSSTNTLSGSNIISGNINSSGTNTFSGSNVMSFGAGTSASPSIYFASDTNTGIFSPAADTIAFTEGGAEAMRINSSGNLRLGLTGDIDGNNPERFGVSYTYPQTGMAMKNGATDQTYAILFTNPNGIVGSIQTGASATSYVTSSDYRLKENIAPMTGALAKVALLKPVTYKWKVDGSDGEGFIAHELQEVAPYAVSGEKDGEEMQGVDYGKITPLLTAALQEAIAEIQSLKARVAELEAK